MCFYYVPRSLAIIALDDVSGPFSSHYPFSSHKAELKHILQIKKHCKNTVDSLCCSVTADQCRSLVANSKGSFTADLQAN